MPLITQPRLHGKLRSSEESGGHERSAEERAGDGEEQHTRQALVRLMAGFRKRGGGKVGEIKRERAGN